MFIKHLVTLGWKTPKCHQQTWRYWRRRTRDVNRNQAQFAVALLGFAAKNREINLLIPAVKALNSYNWFVTSSKTGNINVYIIYITFNSEISQL